MSIGGYACAIFIIRMMPLFGLDAPVHGLRLYTTSYSFVVGLLFGGICARSDGMVIGIQHFVFAVITWPSLLWALEIIRVVLVNIDSALG